MATLKSRLSQALHTYGTGAIADFPNLSIIIASPDIDTSWGVENSDRTPKVKIEDKRLASVFGVSYFIQPPLGNLVQTPDDNNLRYSIKAHRFPNVLLCSRCNYLFSINEDLKVYHNQVTPPNLQPDNRREGYKCPRCNIDNYLSPIRFVIATENGHLDDFPWDWFVHRNSENKNIKRHINGNDSSCFSRNNKRNLVLESKGPALSDMYIKCVGCGAKESLGSIFNQEDTFMRPNDNYLHFTKGYLAMPHKQMVSDNNPNGTIIKYYWQEPTFASTNNHTLNDAKNNPQSWSQIKSNYPVTLQRGASNVYFPLTYKSISIPNYEIDNVIPKAVPETFILTLNLTLCNSPLLEGYSSIDEKINHLKVLDDIGLCLIFGYGQNPSVIREYIKQLYPDQTKVTLEPPDTKSKLRKEEFDLFVNGNNFNGIDWYKSRHYGDGQIGDLSPFLDRIVILDKLREVRVLKGFTRVRPLAFEELIFTQNANQLNDSYKNEFRRIRDVRNTDSSHVNNYDITDWLPGIEVLGEGFFLHFNEATLCNWESDPIIINRVKILESNYINSLKRFGSIPNNFDVKIANARYVLLHTISHIIIDALASDCGYNTASISEIIYSNKDSDQFKMNGILIYTSSPDSEGTLGGLAEQGSPENLNNIFRKAVDKAKWCSSDPLCIETVTGQGFMGVNLAACHSCCMLPETSCENQNKFLDRALLVGTLNNPGIGFFKKTGYI